MFESALDRKAMLDLSFSGVEVEYFQSVSAVNTFMTLWQLQLWQLKSCVTIKMFNKQY